LILKFEALHFKMSNEKIYDKQKELKSIKKYKKVKKK